MKIDFLSDLHLDFWCKPNANAKRFETFCTHTMFDEGHEYGEVLIVAGDLGHYNNQTKIFFEFLIETRYKKIFCVAGNHDLYLINKSQKKKYDSKSMNRIKELTEMFKDNNDIYFLDGDVIEYNGVRFGGAMGWYDGTYCNKVEQFCNPLTLWKQYSNDSVLIYGFEDFYDILTQEKPKVLEIYNKCDIMITHINPMPHAMFMPEKYRLDPVTGFYTFDGENLVDDTDAKFWIYGHQHYGFEKEVYDTTLMCNALGYPGIESKYQKVVQIEFSKN